MASPVKTNVTELPESRVRVEAGRRDPSADEEAVDAEIETLRERMARVETVEEPAGDGHFVVMDYRGTVDGEPFAGGENRDQMIELGSGRLIPGFEDQLQGATAGEERTVTVTFPDDYGAEHIAGKTAEFAVTVKEVKAKELPDLDDDLASDAAGLDTLEELREDIRERLREADEREVEAEFRESAVDAAVADATVDVPERLVEARARELWERLATTLARQGISREAYLQISGKSEEAILEEARPDAERALRREAVLAAIVEAEGIEVAEEELIEALEHSAEHEDTTPEKLLARLEQAGRLDALREDLATRKAVELLAETATPIEAERARAREKLWKPGEEEAGETGGQPPGKLWTPGS